MNPTLRNILIGCGALSALGVLLVIAVLVVVLIGGGEDQETASGPDAPDSPAEEPAETFSNDNYGELVKDPDAHSGAGVEVVGKVFQPPDSRLGENSFQMWVDPQNAEWNTVVFAEDPIPDLKTDDYVRVKGTVEGAFEGENLFGGTATATEVRAESIEVVDATALDPARKTVEVGKAKENNGFSVTVEKVEFGEETTRVYVKARNGTDQPASFYAYDARIVQGSRQIDASENAYEYASLEPQSDLEPGVETAGVLTFGPADPSAPLKLRLKWYSENYDITPEPLVFTVQP